MPWLHIQCTFFPTKWKCPDNIFPLTMWVSIGLPFSSQNFCFKLLLSFVLQIESTYNELSFLVSLPSWQDVLCHIVSHQTHDATSSILHNTGLDNSQKSYIDLSDMKCMHALTSASFQIHTVCIYTVWIWHYQHAQLYSIILFNFLAKGTVEANSGVVHTGTCEEYPKEDCFFVKYGASACTLLSIAAGALYSKVQ